MEGTLIVDSEGTLSGGLSLDEMVSVETVDVVASSELEVN